MYFKLKLFLAGKFKYSKYSKTKYVKTHMRHVLRFSTTVKAFVLGFFSGIQRE